MLSYSFKELNKMQRRATIWILDAFQTLPSFGIEAIAGLIPVHLHLQKLSGRSQLRAYSLPHNYILRLLLELNPSVSNTSHLLSLDILTQNKDLWSKGWLSTFTIGSMKYPLHLIYLTENFLWILVLLTFSIVIFISLF